ncbi:MAG: GH1 family beta-glucosidase [Elusimicrobiota bacterium]
MSSTRQEPFLKFPKDFIWGVSTSAYQIEGAWNEDGRGESIWDRFCHTPGKIANAETGDIACNHYHLMEEDVNMMAGIGLNAYRFSVSWPRIIPEGVGRVNRKGIDFYSRLVDALLGKKIVPFIALHHWDLPQVLEDKGGWRNKDTSYAYADYVAEVVKHLSDRVVNWMTFNEIPSIAIFGYENGEFAPGAKESPKVLGQVIHNLFLAHGLGCQAIRGNAKKKPEVGICHNPEIYIPRTDSAQDWAAVKNAWLKDDQVWANPWWLEPLFHGQYPKLKKDKIDFPEVSDKEMKIISTPMDFFGLSAYVGSLVEADETPGFKGFKKVPYPEDHPKTLMGKDWYITPDCIYYALKALHEIYKVPKFYIAENGCSLNDIIASDGHIHDEIRIKYLKDHFASAHRAISEGINIAGYFVWSIMDHLEWSKGYIQRFGITYIDYEAKQKRILKDSANWYKEVIKNNGLVNKD